MLQLDKLSLCYDSKYVFQNISCTLPTGTVLAIVGKSGCGKSSLLRIIAGLEEPKSGNLSFNEKSIIGKSGGSSFMQQEDLLLPYLKACDNVAMPLRVGGMQKKTAREKAHAMLSQFQLEDVAEYYPLQLSGGMRQRIALLRACVTSPTLLLLDEPFSKLDAITKEECQDWSRKVWEAFNSTVVLVTHDITEALHLAHFIAVLGGSPASFRLFENIQGLLTSSNYIQNCATTREGEISQAVKQHIISFL